MAFKKGDKRPDGAGRRKGQKNKLTSDVRSFIERAAENFQKNPETAIESIDPKIFWGQIYSKLLPKDINIKAQIWTRQLSDEELDAQIQRLQQELEQLK